MKRYAFTSLVLLALVLSACNLPTATGGQPAGPGAEATRMAESVAQTLAAAMSQMPPATVTPSLTPEPSATFTPSVPTVSVSSETNCRTGPAIGYDLISKLVPGQTAEVIGRDTYGNYWVIKNPGGATPAFCWLWGEYATVSGDWQSLPVFDTPPTPTPAPGFSVSYLSTVTCTGVYAFRFQITNTGAITWNSYKIDISDPSTATNTTFTDDYFTDYTGCGPFANQLQDLENGEVGVAGNWNTGLLTYNPAGHTITATFTLCPQNGMLGTCSTKTITFTP